MQEAEPFVFDGRGIPLGSGGTPFHVPAPWFGSLLPSVRPPVREAGRGVIPPPEPESPGEPLEEIGDPFGGDADALGPASPMGEPPPGVPSPPPALPGNVREYRVDVPWPEAEQARMQATPADRPPAARRGEVSSEPDRDLPSPLQAKPSPPPDRGTAGVQAAALVRAETPVPGAEDTGTPHTVPVVPPVEPEPETGIRLGEPSAPAIPAPQMKPALSLRPRVHASLVRDREVRREATSEQGRLEASPIALRPLRAGGESWRAESAAPAEPSIQPMGSADERSGNDAARRTVAGTSPKLLNSSMGGEAVLRLEEFPAAAFQQAPRRMEPQPARKVQIGTLHVTVKAPAKAPAVPPNQAVARSIEPAAPAEPPFVSAWADYHLGFD